MQGGAAGTAAEDNRYGRIYLFYPSSLFKGITNYFQTIWKFKRNRLKRLQN
jgi:hypothetical protein